MSRPTSTIILALAALSLFAQANAYLAFPKDALQKREFFEPKKSPGLNSLTFDGDDEVTVPERIDVTHFDPTGHGKHKFVTIPSFKASASMFKTQSKTNNVGAATIVLNYTCGPSVTPALCTKGRAAMTGAVNRITSVFKIDAQINVDARFISFCRDQNDPSLCNTGVLGAAAPNALIKFPSANTALNGYLFPQSLVKQLATNPANIAGGRATAFNYNANDIFAMFNADFGTSGNLYFPGDPAITPQQYDFEFLFLHEVVHGMGFTSTYNEVGTGLLAPSLQQTAAGYAFDAPYVFDYYVKDTLRNVAFYDPVFSRIPASANIQTFEASFNQLALTTSQALFRAATTARGLLYTPSTTAATAAGGTAANLAVYLNTPTTYSGGSSVAHVDKAIYGTNSIEFLMRPEAIPGVALDNLIRANNMKSAFGPRTLALMASMGYTLNSATDGTTTGTTTGTGTGTGTGTSTGTGSGTGTGTSTGTSTPAAPAASKPPAASPKASASPAACYPATGTKSTDDAGSGATSDADSSDSDDATDPALAKPTSSAASGSSMNSVAIAFGSIALSIATLF